MELDKKRFSIRRHITLVLTLLTVLIVLLIGVCVAVVREQSRTRLTSAADSYLSLLTRTLENQLVIQESYITSQVLNSEELHRLGFGEGHTQAYLDSYKLHTGFSSAMAAGNDVTALYLYSEPNSILMSEYATAQAGRPTETQIQKTNLEETLRSMVDAKTLNDERWTPYVVSGQQYWVRAVHYYGAWLISVVNLDRQCSQATDGMLAFAQPDGVLLAGTRPEEGELSHYISLTAETEGLVLEYYVPSTDMDLDNAMNLALAVSITAVLAAICFVIWYLRSNVVHPLDALVDAMRRISAGDLSVRADWNPVNLELQQVKEAFNVMLNEIETLKIEQYEQKLDAERQEMAALKMPPALFPEQLKADLCVGRNRPDPADPADDFTAVQTSALCDGLQAGNDLAAGRNKLLPELYGDDRHWAKIPAILPCYCQPGSAGNAAARHDAADLGGKQCEARHPPGPPADGADYRKKPADGRGKAGEHYRAG